MAEINRRNLLAGSITLATAAYTHQAPAAQQSKEQAQPSNLTSPNHASAWPLWDASDEQGLIAVLNSGRWGRHNGGRVAEFEKRWCETMQAKYCVATSSGTSALLTALGALGIGPGDEVILPPYTFVATFNVITANYALPMFVDSDLESFQIDARKIGRAITNNTKLVLPVHIAGTPADLDTIGATSKDKGIPFIEDACQAPLAVWRGKPVGTHGLGGCFSFQASKNINSGEGGAVITNDEAFANKCYNFHTPGGGRAAPSVGRGANFRLTEFQGSLLLSQLARLEAQSKIREQNANYLTSMLSKLPGVIPAKLYDGVERSAWHLYMFRIEPKQFGGMTRDEFVAELRKAGISASGGYSPLNHSAHVLALAGNPHYQKIYGSDFMARWADKNQCPVNDQLCSQAVWFTQTTLFGQRTDMERIASAIGSIHNQANRG